MVAAQGGLSEPGTGDRVEAEAFWVAFDPDKQSGPRCMEVLFFVAPGHGEHVWQCLEPNLRRHGRLSRKGGADARTDRAVLRARCAPGNGGRLSADWRGGRTGAQGSAHVSHGEAGTRSVARLAHGGGGDACRDGEDRRSEERRVGKEG